VKSSPPVSVIVAPHLFWRHPREKKYNFIFVIFFETQQGKDNGWERSKYWHFHGKTRQARICLVRTLCDALFLEKKRKKSEKWSKEYMSHENLIGKVFRLLHRKKRKS